MKERPILFSGAMVRAILAGNKTQTRREVKARAVPIIDECFRENGKWCPHTVDFDLIELCPYGKPGDRLWVRESWNVSGLAWMMKPRDTAFAAASAWRYQADDATGWQHGWRPSIHMPRWASRILLEIVAVRVERLVDICEGDLLAEGVRIPHYEEKIVTRLTGKFRPADYWPVKTWAEMTAREDLAYQLLRGEYAGLWESLNGAGSWKKNPWVWVVEFKRVEVGR